MVMAIVAIPAVVAAQTPPPPPTPPALPPAPAPVAAPATPVPPLRTPRPVLAPMPMDVWAIEDALRAADWARIDAVAAREAAAQALDHARVITPTLRPHEFDFHYQDAVSLTRSGDSSYSSCLSLVSQRKYDDAVVRCDRVIQQKGPRTDAALYWKAYAQYQVRKNEDALATLAQLRKEYPQSQYLRDAKVLENDVRRVDPTTLVDPEVKLLAIQSMQHQDPEKAIPLLEGVLNATNAPNVKRNALFVLAQSTHPRARQIILSYAKGQGTPDLQLEAIRYLRTTSKDRQATANELRQIYESTNDLTVRRAIISAYTDMSDRMSLVSIASTSTAPVALRSQAISGLSNVAAPSELWALYAKETEKDLKLQMVSAFRSMQAFDQLVQIVKTEKDPTVRAAAVRALGGMKTDKTGQILADLYSSDQDVETRKAVISAFASQNNAEGLVAIARKETNKELRYLIVERLSGLARNGSKAAADYMAEIIR
jgi:HEAT repeat protein